MPPSQRWKRLETEVLGLRRHFLPKSFNALGIYARPTQVQARTRAFLVLGHAEIESFLEDWAKDIARKCEVKWVKTGRLATPLTFLVATSDRRVAVPETLSGAPGDDIPQRFSRVVSRRLQDYYKTIKDNHGVREKNVLALFTPIGAPRAAYGSTLLPDLDSFGSLRGRFAHQSGKGVQLVADPETEYKRVIGLIRDITVLDDWLVKCRAEIR